MPSAPDITFDVRLSRLLVASAVGMTVLAFGAIVISRLPFIMVIAACVLVGGYACFALRGMRRQTVRAAAWRGDGTWRVHLVGGDEVEARLASGHRLGPAIFLVLRSARLGRTSLILLPDNADTDTRRRIRMRLSAVSDRG